MPGSATKPWSANAQVYGNAQVCGKCPQCQVYGMVYRSPVCDKSELVFSTTPPGFQD